MLYSIRQHSVQTHTIEERNRLVVVVNQPLTFALEDIFIRATEGRKKCIKATFCGLCLIPSIEQFHPGFANPSNQITVQKNIRTVGIVDDLRVRNFQILIVTNGINDLLFDFTHDWLEKCGELEEAILTGKEELNPRSDVKREVPCGAYTMGTL